MAANDIILDSGFKEYNLFFEELNVRVPIRFNPNDPGILTRLEDAEKNISESVKEIDVDSSTDGELVEKVRQIICDQIDHIFNAPVAADMFRFCHPLTLRPNGEPYMIYVMNAVSKVIRRDVDAANKKAESYMSKHIGKYKKGKR